MHTIDWLIMLVPFAAVLWLAVYTRKYARDAVDFLAAGRVAGRYVICVGDLAASLSVITLVANCEAIYKVGSAMGFWNILMMPIGMFLGLFGYCTYRWRATRALSLLLDNAMKFTHPAEAAGGATAVTEKARVVLRVSLTTDQQVAFTVEDTGSGVPPEEAEHIFDEFVQLDEYYDGTGIGLTVARSIARRLGGDITLDTTYTDGARFVFTHKII